MNLDLDALLPFPLPLTENQADFEISENENLLNERLSKISELRTWYKLAREFDKLPKELLGKKIDGYVIDVDKHEEDGSSGAEYIRISLKCRFYDKKFEEKVRTQIDKMQCSQILLLKARNGVADPELLRDIAEGAEYRNTIISVELGSQRLNLEQRLCEAYFYEFDEYSLPDSLPKNVHVPCGSNVIEISRLLGFTEISAFMESLTFTAESPQKPSKKKGKRI